MTRIKFEDLPSKKTPITGDNLNKLNNLAIGTTIEGHDEEVVLIKGENQKSEIYANGEKYSDTVSVGTEHNNAGLWVEKNERQLLSNIINTQTKNGITLTSKGNGVYILNGTATAGTDFALEKYNFISGKKYFLTGGYNTNSFLYIQNNGSDRGSGLSYNPTSDSSFFVGLYINSGTTLSNVEIKPMLEYGTSSKGFEPIIIPSIKVNGEAIARPNVYSTSEVVIGEWLGKPLYRSVYTSNAYSSSYLIPIANIENIIDVKGFIRRKDYTGLVQQIPSRTNNSSYYLQINNFGINTNSFSIDIEAGSGLQAQINKIVLIIEYTKTTD